MIWRPEYSPWDSPQARSLKDQLKDKLWSFQTRRTSDIKRINILIRLAMVYALDPIESNVVRPIDPVTSDFTISTKEYRRHLQVLSREALIRVLRLKGDSHLRGYLYLRIPRKPFPLEVFQNKIIEWAIPHHGHSDLLFYASSAGWWLTFTEPLTFLTVTGQPRTPWGA